ncbi:MAG TPA: response regulator [Bryobacteraceae bacterium]|nr:response regulator [Bryobacteraceae bacterium]
MTEAAAAFSKARILIVDDNRMGLVARKHVLEEVGHEVSIAQSAHDALARFRSEPYDVVVTDFKMPQMTGVDLIRDMRAVNPEVPIVLISGFTDALGLDEETTGADAVIQKSHSEVQTLVRTVTRLLNRAKKKPPKKQPPSAPPNARRRGS